MEHKAFSFRIYPTREQEKLFLLNAAACRFTWNKLLELEKNTYETTGKFIFGYNLTNEIVALKKENDWLKEALSQSLQQTSLHLIQALRNRFSKTFKKNAGFPKFKSSKRSKVSFSIPQHFTLAKNQIKLPKIGWVSGIFHRKLEGKVKSVTVSRDVDQWFISILCELPEKEIQSLDITSVVGIDLGIKTFATTSDGELIQAPTLSNEWKKLKKLQRRHSRKTRGSKNREKARIKVARQYRKIRRISKDFIEKTSTAIAKQYDVVIMEDLNIAGMKKNRRLALSIQKLSWHKFKSRLRDKAKHFHEISRWFPSSKLCSNCGWKKTDLTLADRTFVCDCCGFKEDRDINAALNLRRTVESAGIVCGGIVRATQPDSSEAEMRSSCASTMTMSQAVWILLAMSVHQ